MASYLRTAILLGVALFLLGGCGDEENDRAPRAAEEVIERAVLTDGSGICELYSPDFISRVFGSEEACVAAEAEKSDSPPEDVEILDSRSDGDREATVTVQEIGGQSDGASGDVELVRVDGEWRIDDFAVGYLRAQLTAALEGETGEELGAEASECLERELDAIADPEFRELAYGVIAERPAAEKQLRSIMASCLSGAQGSGGLSRLRRQFERGIRKAAIEDGSTPAQAQCVVEQLRETISDEQIAAQARKGGGSSPAMTQAAAEAIRACAEQG